MRMRDVMTRAAKRGAETARLMVGVPDYETYLAHRRTQHPGEPAMSRADFHRERIERRFGGGAGRISRCC